MLVSSGGEGDWRRKDGVEVAGVWPQAKDTSSPRSWEQFLSLSSGPNFVSSWINHENCGRVYGDHKT